MTCTVLRSRAALWGLLLMAIAASGVLVSGRFADGATEPPPQARPQHWMQILSPGPTAIVTDNQRVEPRPYTVDIDEAGATVRPGWTKVRGISRGMKNVGVIVPAGSFWYMAIPEADGSFSVDVPIPDETGPLPIEIYAWDTPPGDNDVRVELKARAMLFVVGGKVDPDRATEPGGPAAGMRLAWSDEFDTPLSIGSAAFRNATWFAGGKPSWNGSQYSDALFVRANDPRQPFHQRNGFLRIRAVRDPAMADPDHWGRTWWSGHLSTGFPDGTASIALREGYAEIRMMTPSGQGAWPGFWLMDTANILSTRTYGEVEIDVVEAYSHDPSRYFATLHRHPGPSPADGPSQATSQPVLVRGNANLFHTYGVRITHDEVVWYHDGAEVFRAPLYRADVVSPFYIMVDLALGSGWPVVAPPAGEYELWVDYVRVYK